MKSPRTVRKKKGYTIFHFKNKRGFQHVPKKKRIRKKKGWLFCSKCNSWFRRFDGTWATLRKDKYVCNECLIKIISS